MPESYTYTHIATNAMLKSGRMAANIPVFYAGANGPDPLNMYSLFHKKDASRLVHLALRMHKEKTGFFLFSLIKNSASALQRSYTSGFLVYYAANCVLNPYIAAMDGKGPYNGPKDRRLFESRIAATLYYSLYKTEKVPAMAGTPVLIADDLAQVSALLSRTVNQVYHEDIPPVVLADAFHSNTRAHRMMDSPFGIKKSFFRTFSSNTANNSITQELLQNNGPIKRLPPLPCPWSNPYSGEMVDKTFDEMIALSEDRGSVLLKAAGDFWDGEAAEQDLADVIGNNNYYTGLPLRDDHSAGEPADPTVLTGAAPFSKPAKIPSGFPVVTQGTAASATPSSAEPTPNEPISAGSAPAESIPAETTPAETAQAAAVAGQAPSLGDSCQPGTEQGGFAAQITTPQPTDTAGTLSSPTGLDEVPQPPSIGLDFSPKQPAAAQHQKEEPAALFAAPAAPSTHLDPQVPFAQQPPPVPLATHPSTPSAWTVETAPISPKPVQPVFEGIPLNAPDSPLSDDPAAALSPALAPRFAPSNARTQPSQELFQPSARVLARQVSTQIQPAPQPVTPVERMAPMVQPVAQQPQAPPAVSEPAQPPEEVQQPIQPAAQSAPIPIPPAGQLPVPNIPPMPIQPPAASEPTPQLQPPKAPPRPSLPANKVEETLAWATGHAVYRPPAQAPPPLPSTAPPPYQFGVPYKKRK